MVTLSNFKSDQMGQNHDLPQGIWLLTDWKCSGHALISLTATFDLPLLELAFLRLPILESETIVSMSLLAPLFMADGEYAVPRSRKVVEVMYKGRTCHRKLESLSYFFSTGQVTAWLVVACAAFNFQAVL
ncbi:hypothetical protein BDN71DRAFT_1220412 [Pleurotus eryngii]|uniref:Uncharacterized protein n=1 Tax=Pleurotus eryngii TaxID=5323 RepID=A0A9P5ZRL3_PLEER|nr:hypothetical protein BDN71DRAFT_1220412 [Pleurotus eryngii]